MLLEIILHNNETYPEKQNSTKHLKYFSIIQFFRLNMKIAEL